MAYTDRTYTPQQAGAKNEAWPLQSQGDYYAKTIRRTMICLAGEYAPIIQDLSSFTNLLAYSEAFTNTAWTATAVTVTDNNVTSPYGGATASKLIETAANSAHSIAQNANVSAVPQELYVFANAALTRQWIRLAFTDSAATTFSAYFNVAGGTVGTTAASTTAQAMNIGKGYQCCAIRFTPAAGVGTYKVNLASADSNISYAGNTSQGMHLWGAQVCAGNNAPYINTTNVARAVSSPPVDANATGRVQDPLAFLAVETEPDASTTDKGFSQWSRLYARIPKQLTVPTSFAITKPDPDLASYPGVLGDFRIIQPDTTLLQYDAYAATTVTSDSGVPGFYPTGGTYTITFDGDTTGNLNYNDSSATVQTALNALASVTDRGGLTVSGTYNSAGGFSITFNSYSALTLGTGSLTSSVTLSTTISTANGGYNQTARIYAGDIDAATPSVNTSSLANVASATATQTYRKLTYDIQGQASLYIYTGTFTITAYGQTTAAIPYTVSQSNIESYITASLTNLVAKGTLSITLTRTGTTATDYILIEITVTPTAITGGTYTISIFGQTTAAINYNASLASIKSALDALSEVSDRGLSFVTGAGYASGEINVVVSFYNSGFTGAAGFLTPSGSTITPAITDGIGRLQTITFSASSSTRTIYAASHGCAQASTIYLKSAAGTYYVGIATAKFIVQDANTIVLLIASADAYASATTISEVGPRTKQSYTPGTSTVRASRVTNFYLPGVTTGITTAADIPVVTSEGDGAAILQAIFALSDDAFVVSAGDLSYWLNTPILAQEYFEVKPSSV